MESDNKKEQKQSYFESEDLMIATHPDKNGAYIAHFKTTSIPMKPKNEYERALAFQKALEEAKEAGDKLKEVVANLKY
jgi:hypothetical protein